jgi:hypothetical protein
MQRRDCLTFFPARRQEQIDVFMRVYLAFAIQAIKKRPGD